MAMLAHKASVPTSMGLGSSSGTSIRDYAVGPSQRTPAMTTTTTTTHHGPFASPTESEFSEAYDTHDSIR